VPVGTVGYIAIDPDNIERYPRHAEAAAEYTDQGRYGRIAGDGGDTGGSYIELSGGTQNSPDLVSDNGEPPVIKSKDSGLQSVLDDAPKLLAKLNQLADQANSLLSNDNIKRLSSTFDHLDKLSASLDELGPDAKQPSPISIS